MHHGALYNDYYPREYYCFLWRDHQSVVETAAYTMHHFAYSPFGDPYYGHSLSAALVFRFLIEFYGAEPVNRKLGPWDFLPEYVGEDALCVHKIQEWCNGMKPLIHAHDTFDRPGLKRALYRLGLYCDSCYAAERKTKWAHILGIIKDGTKDKYPVLPDYKKLSFSDLETYKSEIDARCFGAMDEYVIRKADGYGCFSIFAKPHISETDPQYFDPEIVDGFRYIYSCDSVELARAEISFFEESISHILKMRPRSISM